MKIWIFSVVVHALLLWALSFIIIPAPEKPSASAVIQSYSYTETRVKPVPPVVAEQLAMIETTPPQSDLPAKKNTPEQKVKTSETAVVTRAAGLKSDPEATENTEVVETTPSEVVGPMSLAERALASISAKASEPMTERNQQREIVLNSSNPVDPDLVPDPLKSLKTFADGSSLINANGVCWRVPPPEAGKDALWLFAGVSCSGDTKTRGEQINDILQKRRTYAED